ncbi:hypothetical protein HLB23_21860 [Nocardia uniformis]|uniref:Uncharacterized protein n=1 Tax=Nocardia uniformis TaxID=53432 RepID=A0A849CG98_9NOCA|nr:hypothetical protein [Nocardia uniformis]NNH72471.1 hypothetical protein [Nocardia uniformis]
MMAVNLAEFAEPANALCHLPRSMLETSRASAATASLRAPMSAVSASRQVRISVGLMNYFE